MALFLAPATAVAQEPPHEAKSPDGQLVRLNVRDSNGLQCLSVQVGAETTATRTAPCAAPPADAKADVTGVRVVYRATPEKLTVVYGIASAQTARLQLRFGNGGLVEVRPQGARRTYLAVFRGRPPLASTRAVDAQGRDLAAADIDPRALTLKPRRGPYTLRRILDERGNQSRFDAFTTPLLPPGALRRRRAVCVSVGDRNSVPRSNAEPGYAGGSACSFERGRIAVKFAAGCSGADRLVLFGIGPSIVRRYVLVLGSGARRELLTNRLPRKLRRPGYRAFIYSNFSPGPLDRLEAYGRGDKRLASLPLASVGSGCVSSRRS